MHAYQIYRARQWTYREMLTLLLLLLVTYRQVASWSVSLPTGSFRWFWKRSYFILRVIFGKATVTL